MPIGEGRLLSGHEIVMKDNLYVSGTLSNGVPGVLFSIWEQLLGHNLMFAEGKVLPGTTDHFEKWYR